MTPLVPHSVPVAQRSRELLEEQVRYYEDVLGVCEDLERLQQLKDVYGLPHGPARLLSRLVAANGRLVRRDALIDELPGTDRTRDIHPKTVDVYMVAVRRAVGADGVETVWSQGFRLTIVGIQRIKAALAVQEAA